MRRHTLKKVAGWTGALLALLAFAGTQAAGDDTQLFRSEAGKPYVYIILDTSTSMNTAQTNNAWVPANGDDPGSKFRQVKEALLEVFSQVYRQNGDAVHFGFATYNQDRVKVRGKHWLYKVDRVENPSTITYPQVGEILTFGKHLELGGTTVNGVAGDCTAPLALPASLTQTGRLQVNRFPKLNPHDLDDNGDADKSDPTTLWLQQSGKTYRLDVTQDNGELGDASIRVKFTLRTKTPSDNCPNASNPVETTVELSYVTEFLMVDEGTGTGDDSAQLADCTGNEKNEARAGVGWTWSDVSAINTCGGKKPFSGRGWESNYDSLPLPAGFTGQDNVDPISATNPYNYKFPNQLASARPLDSGDMIPYHWSDTHRVEFFKRLAPNWDESRPVEELEFRAAAYFRDAPRPGLDYLELRDPDQRPLLPFGASPLSGAIVDFRCFYLGIDDNKCKVDEMPFGTGWDDLAKSQDFEFGCRKPFLIVVGDGEAHGNNNDATSAVANLRSVGLAKTWAVNFGGCNAKGECDKNSTYHSLANSGGGECVCPQTKQDLVDVLKKIVGVIIESSRSFSSAAVPTVQADVADRVFLSNFTPLNDDVAPAWPGHMNAFVKDVPQTADFKPDLTKVCPTFSGAGGDDCSSSSCPARSVCTDTLTGRRCLPTSCLLWDAGAALLTQYQTNPLLRNGLEETKRRVYYSELTANGQWPKWRHFFNPLDSTSGQQVRFDLWRGFGIPFVTDETADPNVNKTALDTANEVVTETLAKKLADLNTPPTPTNTADDTPFLLGDIFHSTPVAVGSPVNTVYFARNVVGYRDFSLKHQKRRKMLLVGANDGMLHAFDAGHFDVVKEFFTNGTGKEVFAFIPRGVLSTLKELYAGADENRTWTVDGSVTVADVRIDPAFDSAPNPDKAEWRTVAVGALREGGVGYYALDITQPDPLETKTDHGKTFQNVPKPGAGGFVPGCMDGDPDPKKCGPNRYPSQLWEFRDGIYVPGPSPLPGRVIPLDEDGNGVSDLAAGWSTPNIGRIRVIDTKGDEVDRYVAVFGGGLDKTENAGTWLYMVDMETGQAIYKQRLFGAAPSEPSAVDTDQDGYLDRIYIGTTRGYVYRVDLRRKDGSLPQLELMTVSASFGGSTFTQQVARITGTDFTPRPIFKAQADPDTAAVPARPIYYRASVIFIAKLNEYALAFGTGDRENLFNFDNQTGRFYVFRDSVAVDDRKTFYTEADLQAIAPGDPALADSVDFLTDVAASKRGWYLTLDTNERVITNPFALSGILVFTAFKPNPTPPDTARNPKDTLFCRRDGTSRIFGVTATNGNALLLDADKQPTRFVTIGDFVTDPYTEQGVTKNPLGPTPEPLPPGLPEVLEQLKKLFPPNCKFGSYRIDVKTLSSDTGIIFIAPVPVCIIEKNWREF
jgi:PilC-like protein with beta-propeller domain